MVINGFKFYVRQHDTAAKYYVAMRGDVVLTSKSLDYLVKKVKKYA
jgi:hypothetical protein